MSLKYAILSLLAHDPLTGYELMKLFDSSVGYFWHATHPQIYKELARLEREGHVVYRTVHQRGRPTKKVYSLSDLGRADLVSWLRIPAGVQRVKDEMMLKTFCCGLVSPEEALTLIREHRELHRARLQQYQELERFLRSGPIMSNPLRLGPYLTLLRGIRYEADYVGWCEQASELFRQTLAHAEGSRRAKKHATKRGSSD